jgi:aspartate/methionine/tyrosine aminotransferase
VLFSSRTNWQHQPNLLSQALERRQSKGLVIHDLTTSNPTECGIHYPGKEILAALSDPAALQYRPDPKGLPCARRTICEYYRRRNSSIDPADIVLTAGTSEAYAMILKLLCDAGDAVLVPKPSYPLFEFLAEINDVKLQHFRLGYDHGWHIDVESIEERISKTTRALVIVNPHNPTGMFLKGSELEAIERIALESRLAVIVDEVFSEYAFSGDAAALQASAHRSTVLTFTLNGISKLLGLPQMKLAWIVASGPPEERREALERLETISDTFLSVNTPVQVALPKLFEVCKSVRAQIVSRVGANYSFLYRRLHPAAADLQESGGPVSLLASEGGWYAIIRVPRIRTDEEWALQVLEQKGVYVHPGYFFDFEEEGFLVISLLPEPGLFREGVEKLVAFVESAV